MEIKDVENLARLARIRIAPDEKQAFLENLTSILGYIDQIQSVSAETPERSVGIIHNVMREDVDPHEGGTYTERILAEAPAHQDGYLKVKQIL